VIDRGGGNLGNSGEQVLKSVGGENGIRESGGRQLSFSDSRGRSGAAILVKGAERNIYREVG